LARALAASCIQGCRQSSNSQDLWIKILRRTGPGGAVTVTLRQLTNAAALQHALAEHGVPAIVHVGDSICFQSDGHPLPGLFRVVTHPPGFPIVIRIRPAAIPHGSELLFSLTRISGAVAYVGQELIRIGAPVSCLHPPSYHSGTNPPSARADCPRTHPSRFRNGH